MSDVIIVRGIKADGHHGLLAKGERDKAQRFAVDIELTVPRATRDDMSATIDYVEVNRVAREVIEKESFELVETIASTIAQRVLAVGGERVRVHVTKLDVARLLAVDEVGVVVERP